MKLNVDTNEWETNVREMRQPRWNTSSCVVDGRVFVVGGIDPNDRKYLSTIEEFNPHTNEWRIIKNEMPTPRHSLGTCVVGGIIFAIGGYHGKKLSVMESFDPKTEKWRVRPQCPIPFTRWIDRCSEMEGCVVVWSEMTVRVFDPRKDSWVKTVTGVPQDRFLRVTVVERTRRKALGLKPVVLDDLFRVWKK